AAIDDPGNAAPKTWSKSTRRWAVWMIGEETRTDKLYAQLTSSMLKRSTDAAAAADVRGVEKAIDAVQRRDAELGGHRPDAVNALLGQLHVQLDAARNLRLVRDRWRERVSSFQAYRRAVGRAEVGLGCFVRSRRLDESLRQSPGGYGGDRRASARQVITPRKTRLHRTANLRAFQHTIRLLAYQSDLSRLRSCAVIVPSAAAADQLRR